MSTDMSTSGPIQDDPRTIRFLKYPYQVGGKGIPATTTASDHLRDLIVQVLFTVPGERVNLPEFGVGIQRLLFEPNSDALQASASFLITTNLRRWLGDRIDIGQVRVTREPGYEETALIEINYTVKTSNESQTLQVQV
jgi:phage baseplate assembly protein W